MAEKIDCSLDDVAAALQYLNCSDTDVWLRAGMAIKREFGEAGFDVWDSWSQGDKGYTQKQCLARWKGWKGSNARGSVSIASVLHWAFERGFKIDRPEMTAVQKAAFMLEQETRRAALAVQWAKEEADTLRWYDVVAQACNQLLPELRTVGNSPYLGQKKIQACGAYFLPCAVVMEFKADISIELFLGEKTREFWGRKKTNDANGIDTVFLSFKRGSILIPLYNAQKELRNFQVIYNAGEKKRFLTNGQKSGLWMVIGQLNAPAPAVLFCEGFATGASLWEASMCPVVVCFDANNLVTVAEKWKNYGNNIRPLIVCGDNDWETALDPKKINTGLVKAELAAKALGGSFCVPRFSDDLCKGLSDFNDLQVEYGRDEVEKQIGWAIQNHQSHHVEQSLAMVQNSPDSPPDFGDIPAGDYEEYLLKDSQDNYSAKAPAPSLSESGEVEEKTIDLLLGRYALAMPDAKIWDSLQSKIIQRGAFKANVGAKLFAQWLEHDKRRTVQLDDVQRVAAAAQKEGRGGLAEVLKRYVYLNPSDTAWDKQERCVVALSHLKYAIADCFAMWITHPEREEVPVRNFVFDPTQLVDAKTHINQFRGLALVPVRDDKRCERIVRMMMALCNNDRDVFKWLRRWLAYPLINVGAKMETAVLCHSDVHGSGKSYFFDVVMRQIYGEYSRTVGQAQLEGQYNDWMSKVLYCVYEEVLSRSQKYSHTGTIKQVITGKSVRIEKKFMSGWEESNHMNSVFLSNEVMPLPVEPSDRRFLVIWPETKLYEELQRGVNEDLKNGGAAAFYQFLLDTKLQDEGEAYPFDEHTKPPMTAAKERLVEHGRAVWEVFYNEWERGALEYNGMNVPYGTIRVNDLFQYFSAWCKVNNEHSLGSKNFSSFIGSKIKKRSDLNYDYRSFKGKATFFVIGLCPHDKTQQEWLGACVEGHQEILNKVEYIGERYAA